MTLLVLGLLIWTAAHLFGRVLPEARASLGRAVGDGPLKGIVALFIGLGLVLIIIGYRRAPFVQLYDPPAWGIHVNNLMMLGAVLLMGAGKSRGRARSWLRHPMLSGVLVWAVAHLLVNGDAASLVMFGWLGLWAVATMLLINAREPDWVRPAPGPASGDVRLVLISLVVFAGIVTVHTWLGYWPFPS
jgi:uncharacterized membrane protein